MTMPLIILLITLCTFILTPAIPALPLNSILPKITIREISSLQRPSTTTTGFPIRDGDGVAFRAGTHGKRKDYFNFGFDPAENDVDRPARRSTLLERRVSDLKDVSTTAVEIADASFWNSTSSSAETTTTTGVASSSASAVSAITDVMVTDDMSAMSSQALPMWIRTLPPTTAISSQGMPEPEPEPEAASIPTMPYSPWRTVSSTTAGPVTTTRCPFAPEPEPEISLPVIVTVFPSST